MTPLVTGIEIDRAVHLHRRNVADIGSRAGRVQHRSLNECGRAKLPDKCAVGFVMKDLVRLPVAPSFPAVGKKNVVINDSEPTAGIVAIGVECSSAIERTGS